MQADQMQYQNGHPFSLSFVK